MKHLFKIGVVLFLTTFLVHPVLNAQLVKANGLNGHTFNNLSIPEKHLVGKNILGGIDRMGKSNVLTDPSWGTWTTRASLPDTTGSLAAASLGGVLYVVGGNNNGPLSAAYKYNPQSNSWSSIASLPEGRYETDGLCAIGGKLYLIGGWYGSLPHSTIYIYDTSSNEWTTGASMPALSGDGASGVINGKIYVTNAEDGFSGWQNFFYVYDPVADSWSTLPNSPSAHGRPAYGVIDGKFYVAGGIDGSYNIDSTLDVYDPVANSWATMSAMPMRWVYSGSGVLDGKLYVIGGENGNGVATDSVFIYDPSSNTWSSGPPEPNPVGAMGVAVISDTLYAAGGSVGANNVNLLQALIPSSSVVSAGWVKTSFPAQFVTSFAVSGTNLFAGASKAGTTFSSLGAFLSTDNGASWTSIDSGLTDSDVLALAVAPNGSGGTNLYAAINNNGGVFLSTNNGTYWTPVNTGLTDRSVLCLAVSPNGSGGSNLFAGTYDGGGIFLSTNNGASWNPVDSGMPTPISPVYSFGVNGTNLFAGTQDNGVFLSTNDGTTWAAVNSGLPLHEPLDESITFQSFAFAGNKVFVGTDSGRVFLSTNNGANWNLANSGIPMTANNSAFSLDIIGTNLFAGTGSDGVYLSTDFGTSWTADNQGGLNPGVFALAVNGGYLFAGTYGNGVWRLPISYPDTICVSVANERQYVGDTVVVPVSAVFPTGVQVSSAELSFGAFQNNGLTFLGVDTSSTLLSGQGWQLEINNTDSLLISASAGAYQISGSGILMNLEFVVTGSGCTTVPISITKALFDTGATPVAVTNGRVSIRDVPSYGDVDQNGKIQAYDAALVLKWLVGLDTLDCQQLSNADVTNDGTVSATDARSILRYVAGLISIFPDTSSGTIQASGTATMLSVNAGPGEILSYPINILNGKNIISAEGQIAFDTSALAYVGMGSSSLLDSFVGNSTPGVVKFAGYTMGISNGSGVLVTLNFRVKSASGTTDLALTRFRLNEGKVLTNVARVQVVLGVPQTKGDIPTSFELAQNYPNPFNPTTTIQYALPQASNVRLIVYDILGRTVSILVNGMETPGYKSVTFDASQLPSGVYIYRIEAGTHTATKKLLLMK